MTQGVAHMKVYLSDIASRSDSRSINSKRRMPANLGTLMEEAEEDMVWQQVDNSTLKQQDWTALPAGPVAQLLEYLSSLEIKTARLVCRTWRTVVDQNLLILRPRDLPVSVLCKLQHMLPRTILHFGTVRQKPCDLELQRLPLGHHFPLLRWLDLKNLVGVPAPLLSDVGQLTRLEGLLLQGNHSTGTVCSYSRHALELYGTEKPLKSRR